MTALSVVVANVGHDRDAARASLVALAADLAEEDQLVCADAGGLDPADLDVGRSLERVAAEGGAGRGRLYGLGLSAARHPFVAFTDAATAVQPGWRSAAVAALEAGAVAVGGPVLPGGGRSLVTWAGFFAEYGPHAVSPFTSERGDLSANNVAYLRSALAEVVGPGAPVWKTEVNARLVAGGRCPVVVPAMRVVSTKAYGWSDVGPGRFEPGRLYGTQRAATWSLPRRVAGALGCAVLPALAYARLVQRIARDPGLRRSFAASTPLVVLALSAWSAGEAWGYLKRDGTGHDVF